MADFTSAIFYINGANEHYGAYQTTPYVVGSPFVCAKPKDRANNVAAGCKHTPLRSVASLLRKHCPRPTNVTLYAVHIRWRSVSPSANLTTPIAAHLWQPIFRQQTEPAPLSTPPWQSIFISAQGSLYTIKTVGGEAVRRFFSLENALFLFYCLHFI